MIISIDIGTSYSSISMLGPDGKAQPVDIGTGVSMFGSKYSLPSAVFVEDDGQVLLGQDALNNRMRNPQRFRDEFKRNLGETIPIMMGSRSFLPEELYTEFFRHMKDRAEKISGERIELAYLTHPAAYGTSKKNKILSAAKAAGLYDVELVDEPTAAAMSYCAAGYIKDGQNLLIYDFGGGTFDTALIRYENGSFTLLTSPRGLERCGGIDIDRLIFQDMLSKVDPATLGMLQANNLHYMRFVSQLSELAVKCKHQLSSPEAESFSGYIQVGFDMIPYMLTLEQYNQMIAGMVGQTIQTCRQMLDEAKLKVSDLSAVLLVGGTSRVRLVREMVEQMAGKVPVYCAADLELAVSQGALNYRNYKTVEPEPDPEPEPISEPELNKAKHAVFFVNSTSVNDGTVTVSGSVRGSMMIEDMDILAVYDDEGTLLGSCQAVISVNDRPIYTVTNDCENVTIELYKFTGEIHKDMKIDFLISMPVDEKTYDQAIADLEDDGFFIITRVGYKYENVDDEIDFQDAYFFYVTEISDGKVHGRSISGEINDDHMEQCVYRKDDHTDGFRQKLNWVHYTATGHNAFFVADCSNVRVGDIITDCILPDGYTFKGEQLSSWRYRLTVMALNGQPAASEHAFDSGTTADGQAEQPKVSRENDPKYLDEKGLQFGREGNWRAAFEAFQKAAKMNYAQAQYHLAGCYEGGNGTAVDRNNAWIWYHRAAAQGHTAAKDKLKQLENTQKLKNTKTPEEIIRKLLRTKDSWPDLWHIESSEKKSYWVNRLAHNLGIPSAETVLLAKNTTAIFGAGKDGLILTERGIYHKFWASDPTTFISWTEFAGNDISYQNGIAFNGKAISGAGGLGPDGARFWTRLYEELKKLY